jgi:bifunctional non-homologous end joining protein LigD
MKGPALRQYRDKRDFTQTREPSGDERVAVSTRLRFVIQKHAARRLHYDLRLEWDGVFKSWAVTRGPSLDPAQKRLAVEVEDHPLDYGDFEGTIPQGEYGGGTVQLWDRGYWQPEGPLSVGDAIAKGDLKFTLAGQRLNGSFVLVRMRGDRFGGKKSQWLLIKHRDAQACPGDDDAVLEEDRSVASGRSMAQIAAGKGATPKPFMKTKTSAKAAGAAATKTAVGAKVAIAKPAKRKPVAVKTIPRFVDPQLCRLAERPPDGEGWAHEVKLDGYRAQLHVQAKKVVIHTRNGLDWTDRFRSIATLAKGLPDCLIDGEMVVLDEKGLPSFSLLQSELSAERSEKFHYFAFDLLFEGREDLRALPLEQRKERLKKLLNRPSLDDRIRYVAHVGGDAASVLESARTMGLEGIVSKRLDAPYQSGRGNSWIKIKCRAGQEVVLGGWTSDNGELRSLLAGVHRKGKLVYVGRIGTGYGRRVSTMLLPKLEKLTRQRSPFNGPQAPAGERNLHWLEPKLVAEIEFAGWSGAGMIRQAAFKGLREDKKPSEVVAEIPGAAAAGDALDAKARGGGAGAADDAADARIDEGGHVRAAKAKRGAAAATPRAADVAPKAGSIPVLGVALTKPDKALWPAFGKGREAAPPVTKLDLAHYFESVGEWMLPHLAGRPCSLVRAPDGIGGERFFQRHAMPGMSSQFDLVKVRGDKAAYVQIDKIDALIAAAQIGALELHSWNCTPNDPETAGRLVFDLDPAPDVSFAAVITAAHEVRERLAKVGLDSFCKTTGGKGLHVVTPLTGGRQAVEWPVAKNFAHLLCAQMAKDSPKKYLDTMAKDKRTGRIFLDYLRNDRLATAVTVLSPRAREGAPVSMPVNWSVVKKGLDPAAFTVRTAPSMLRQAKPWKDYVGAAGSLKNAIKRITR